MSINKKTLHLVAGGAGFLGSHLINKLINLGNEVVCLDNFSSGKKINIRGFLNNKDFSLINNDISEPIDIEPDYIWNLACPASPSKYLGDPIQTTKTCSIGTYNLLNLAIKNSSKFIYFSSSEIYGQSTCYPLRENDFAKFKSPGERSCYSEGKRFGEIICQNYLKNFSLDLKIVRIFNTYGPRMYADDFRVISNFVYRAIRNDDLVIYGDGKQTRSFCYVDDLIRGLLKVSNSNYSKPINLGSQEEISIYDLAKKIICKLGSNSKIKFDAPREGEPYRRKPCLELAKQILNWQPIISLDNGLELFIDNLDI